MASWTGDGEISLSSRRGERSSAFDVVLAVVTCLAADALALGAVIAFAVRGHPTVCGSECFDNPHVAIHNNTVTLIAFGVAVFGLLVASLVTRRSRIPVVAMQTAIGVYVLATALPALTAAEHHQDVLKACGYGYFSPCQGVPTVPAPLHLAPAG